MTSPLVKTYIMAIASAYDAPDVRAAAVKWQIPYADAVENVRIFGRELGLPEAGPDETWAELCQLREVAEEANRNEQAGVLTSHPSLRQVTPGGSDVVDEDASGWERVLQASRAETVAEAGRLMGGMDEERAAVWILGFGLRVGIDGDSVPDIWSGLRAAVLEQAPPPVPGASTEPRGRRIRGDETAEALVALFSAEIATAEDLSADLRRRYGKLIQTLIDARLPGADWHTVTGVHAARDEYLATNPRGAAMIRAATNRFTDMLEGKPQQPGPAQNAGRPGWLHLYDQQLRSTGLTDVERTEEITEVGSFVFWAKERRKKTDWQNPQDRLSAWLEYPRACETTSGPVLRWFNAVARQPPETGWSWHNGAANVSASFIGSDAASAFAPRSPTWVKALSERVESMSAPAATVTPAASIVNPRRRTLEEEYERVKRQRLEHH